jgi:steroid 5-alpha reductase family enzyme
MAATSIPLCEAQFYRVSPILENRISAFDLEKGDLMSVSAEKHLQPKKNDPKPMDVRSLIVLVVLPVICGLFAMACGQGGIMVSGIPLFALSTALVFIIQWLAFVPAYLLQTERFFDLTGSVTYVTVVSFVVWYRWPGVDARTLLLACLAVIWAVRLGAFLFSRIHKAGKDDRFDEFKPHFFRFLIVWTMQGVWITLTIAAALAAMTSEYGQALDLWAGAGFFLWFLGFSIEAIADLQKKKFRSKPENKDRFIQSGLWARSRHPNYFGEIVLWIGIALMAVPVLSGWQHLALISPVFVYVLLTRISGIPLLEKKADGKWGGQEEYERYKNSTPVLIPKIR